MLTQYILYMMHVESQIRQIYTHMTQWIPARFYFCQQFVIAIAIAIFLGGQLCLRASFAICFAMQTVASARLVHTQVIQEQKGNRQRRRQNRNNALEILSMQVCHILQDQRLVIPHLSRSHFGFVPFRREQSFSPMVMRERLNISPGTPLISSQMGEVQGGTPTWAASQVMDSGRPPPVLWRRAVLSQGHVPQVALGTAPNVNTSQMTTIPGDVQMGAPSKMFMAQGSVVSMRASSEFEHSRFRELGRQLAIVPWARKNRPALVLQAWVPPEVLLRMMSLQDELREAQVNLAVRNGIASAKQQVAERSLEQVNQGMQLLEQEKDEWKRRVG